MEIPEILYPQNGAVVIDKQGKILVHRAMPQNGNSTEAWTLPESSINATAIEPKPEARHAAALALAKSLATAPKNHDPRDEGQNIKFVCLDEADNLPLTSRSRWIVSELLKVESTDQQRPDISFSDMKVEYCTDLPNTAHSIN